MKTLFLLLTFMASFLNVTIAQDESVFKRINGVKVKDNIFLRWYAPNQVFEYSIEDINNWHPISQKDLIFNIRNNFQNNYKVYFQFYNPLKYSIKSTSKDLDDPAYKSLTEFLSTLSSAGVNATSSASNPPIPAASFKINNEDDIEIKSSILLHEWIYEFIKAIDKTKVETKQNEFRTLVSTINLIIQADKYLFNAFKIEGGKTSTFSNFIKDQTEILFNEEKHAEFNTELQTSFEVYSEINKQKVVAETAISEIKTLFDSKFGSSIEEFIKPELKKDFKDYTKSTIFWLNFYTSDKLENYNNALKRFKDLLDKLQIHVNKFNIQETNKAGNILNYTLDYDLFLTYDNEKWKEFEYEVLEYDKTGSSISLNNSKAKFNVGKNFIFFPFVSSGILYTDLKYHNYLIESENGVNKVVRGKDTKVNLRPSIFLNLLLSKSEIFYPFIQVGISSGSNDIIFPIGVGLSIKKTLSISIGGIVGYGKGLNDLSVNDTVEDQAALDKDLTNKPVTSLYFSINYNLGKK